MRNTAQRKSESKLSYFRPIFCDQNLLYGVVAPQVVYHVAFGAETLSAVLGAVEGSVIVVHTQMHGQVVPVVE